MDEKGTAALRLNKGAIEGFVDHLPYLGHVDDVSWHCCCRSASSRQHGANWLHAWVCTPRPEPLADAAEGRLPTRTECRTPLGREGGGTGQVHEDRGGRGEGGGETGEGGDVRCERGCGVWVGMG